MTTLPPFLHDVEVRREDFPPLDADWTAQGSLWRAGPGSFQMTVPGVARFQCTGGRQMVIAPQPEARDGAILQHARGIPLAALLYQRGIVALHAGAVQDSRGAILIAGPSGSGKSTLLAALVQEGFSLLADDLAPVDMAPGGGPVVYPTFPEVHLWPEALRSLGLEPDPRIHPSGRRRGVRLAQELPLAPVPIRAVLCLAGTSVPPEAHRLKGAPQILRVLSGLTFNPRIAAATLDRGRFLRCVSALARGCSLVRLSMHGGGADLAPWIQAIEENVP